MTSPGPSTVDYWDHGRAKDCPAGGRVGVIGIAQQGEALLNREGLIQIEWTRADPEVTLELCTRSAKFVQRKVASSACDELTHGGCIGDVVLSSGFVQIAFEDSQARTSDEAHPLDLRL